MNSQDIATLQGIAENQWGMVTVAQAQKQGIERVVLSRLASKRILQRVRQGVYTFTIGVISATDEIRAEWLALRPADSYLDRVSDFLEDAIVCGETAAWLHGGADFFPSPFEFSIKQDTQKRQLRLRKRKNPINPVDTVFVSGLPVLSIKATVEDLISNSVDLDQIASFLSEQSTSLEVLSSMRPRFEELSKNYPLDVYEFSQRLMQKSVQKEAMILAESSGKLSRLNNSLVRPESKKLSVPRASIETTKPEFLKSGQKRVQVSKRSSAGVVQRSTQPVKT
jgi:hypothetical protein